MRILYLCTFYHRALLFRQQMDALTARGNDVRAFNSAQFGEGIADKFKPIMDDKVVHCECWNKLDRMLFFPRQWKIERKLEKAFDLKEYDIMHSHLLLSSGYTALRMKKKYGLPYVVSVRATDLNGFIRLPFFKKLAIKILRQSSGVLFLSRSHKEELEDCLLNTEEKDMLDSKSVIIRNCLENFWRDNTGSPRHLDADKKAFHILAVSKILPVKNLPAAAQTVKLLREQGYNADLTIVGEVQDKNEYEKLKNFDFVKILPFMKKEGLINVYRESDIFLLPSVNETFGRVYVEAMTQGLPVLYTRGQGFDKVFPNGTVGYPIPSDSPEKIVECVKAVIKDYDTISQNCIENCKEFYEDTIIDQLENFYNDSLNRS